MGQGQTGPAGPMGPQGLIGPPGPQGDLIKSIDVKDGNFIVEFTGDRAPLKAPAGGPQGPQGNGINQITLEDGNISFIMTDGKKQQLTSDAFRSTFLEQNTIWCNNTDGNLCNFPLNKEGVRWGKGNTEIVDRGDLRISTNNNLRVRVGGTETLQVTKDAMFLKGKDVMGELGLLWQETKKMASKTDVEQIQKELAVLKNKTQKLNEEGDVRGDLQNSGIMIGDWRFVNTWWADDDKAALLVKKDKGNNKGDKFFIRANGNIDANNRTL